MTYPTPELLAQVFGAELEATGLSEREIQRRTGLSRDTLKRRIRAGELKSGDLIRIAQVVGVKTSALVRRAEKEASA